MDRIASMARFDESDTEPNVVAVNCDYDCGNVIHVGDCVVETYDNVIVHADCWRSYCDEMYASKRGLITANGGIY
jgi:hypothetical protein